jgi:hypothetical protein
MPGYESEEDKMKTIIKAQGLHPFAKMAVNIGKENLDKIVNLTRYVQSLARPKSYPFLGLDRPRAFLDQKALQKIMYDPIVGFVWYFQEKGEMDTFGNLVRAAGMASDVPLGTASEVAAVVDNPQKGKMPTIITKKELGMNDQTTQELLMDFRPFNARNPDSDDHEVLEETETNVVKRDVPKLIRYEGDGSPRPMTPPWVKGKSDLSPRYEKLKKNRRS